MGQIKSTFSKVEAYKSNCTNAYSQILNIAAELVSREESVLSTVRQRLSDIEEQITALNIAKEELQHKIHVCKNNVDAAYAELDACNQRINFILNNPIPVTSSDGNGGSVTTHQIDMAALAAAERARDCAYARYQQYSDELAQMNGVMSELMQIMSGFEATKNGISTIENRIESNIMQIKKAADFAREEAGHNIYALQGVVEKLSDYLGSKRFEPYHLRA